MPERKHTDRKQQRVKACPYCGWIGGHALEKVLQQRVEDFARLNGWLAFHVNDSRRPARRRGQITWVGDEDTAGFPDLLLLHPRTGRLLVRELKTCRGTVSANQKKWLDAFLAAGVDAGVWRPKDHDEIERKLSLRAEVTR